MEKESKKPKQRIRLAQVMTNKNQEQDSQEEPKTNTSLPLSKIKPRFSTNTRELKPFHVIQLAESIANVGLIEPIVIDNQNRLLAGGHRLKACQLLDIKQRKKIEEELMHSVLKSKNKEEKENEILSVIKRLPRKSKLNLEEIPVRVYDFDSKKDQNQALEIETSENTQRKDYTPKEVRNLYSRLLEVGYEDVSGRPKKGQKPVKPALALLMGTSIRTVQRRLEKPKEITVDDELRMTAQKFSQSLEKIEQTILLQGDELQPFFQEQADHVVFILQELLEYFENIPKKQKSSDLTTPLIDIALQYVQKQTKKE